MERNHYRKGFLLLLGILVFTAGLSCCVGRYPLTLADLWQICTGSMEDGIKNNVFLRIRLPRTVFAGLTGAALSISGLVYQELFRNPLVSPDVLGAGGGAGVGAVCAIVCGGGAVSVRSSALAGGLLAVALALFLSSLIGSYGGNGRRSVGMVLAGIAVKALADAAVMALKYTADPSRQLPSIDYWLMGSLQNIHWAEVLYYLPFAVLPVVFLYRIRWQIQVMSFGDREAKSLGVPVDGLKLICAAAACIPAAAGTAVTGVISWVGLIVPHMVRRLFGEGLSRNFSLCGLAGASFMMLADLAARSLTAAEIPISILTSAAGALFLAGIFIHRGRAKDTR